MFEDNSPPSEETRIRSFHRADSCAVIRLWQTCGLTRPWNNPALDIERKLSVNDELFLVADSQGTVIGTVMGGYEGHRGWVNYLAVLPERQRQGIAQQLMQTLETRLLAQGCPKINLQVRADNSEVIAFYAKLGFSDDCVLSLGKRLIEDDRKEK